MSYKATNWAYDLPLTGSAKPVLVALADMADEDNSCFPGQRKLAAMTGRSVKTIERALTYLEGMGLLSRVKRYGSNGWRTSDRYVLNLDVVTLDLPDKVTTSQNDYQSESLVVNLARLPDILSTTTRQGDGAEEPSVKPSVKPSGPKSKKKPSTRLSDSWLPGEACLIFARENNIDLHHEVGQFRAHVAANDRKQVNWDAAFRMWLGNVIKWRKPGDVPKPNTDWALRR